MKEIILIVVIFGLLIFFLWVLRPPKQKKLSKNVEKPKEKVKDEIPEILKEVTMGNYMYDIAQTTIVDGIEVVEDDTIELPAEQKEDKRSQIEKAFDEISDIGSDYDEDMEDVFGDENLLDGIDEEFDDEILINDNETTSKTNSKKRKSLTEEYRGLSKEMKAMLIANILEKKHKK